MFSKHLDHHLVECSKLKQRLVKATLWRSRFLGGLLGYLFTPFQRFNQAPVEIRQHGSEHERVVAPVGRK
jgi:hypothetical protein